MTAELKDQPKTKTILSPEEGRAWFDKRIPELLEMSGEEYLRRYDAGEFADMPDDFEHMKWLEAEFLIALARPNR